MWLDDIIGVFSPQSAFKRKQARIAIDVLARGYEGAKTGRRIDDWITSGTSANAEISGAGNRLRERSRDLVRNNCYGSKAVEIFVGNAIGTGITAQARTSSERLNKQIMAAWNEWCQFCDADGDLDFYGLQALAARAMYESGECFILFRDRGLSSTMRVPLQLQILEADFLDTAKSTVGENGNTRIRPTSWPCGRIPLLLAEPLVIVSHALCQNTRAEFQVIQLFSGWHG